jgi:hypothetical protein
MLTILTMYPIENPYPRFKSLPRIKRAMGTGFYSILNASEDSELAKSLLQHIPIYVHDVLGKDQPTFEDVLGMPEPTESQLERWLVYVDCTIRLEVSRTNEPLFDASRIVRKGKYVGSSVDTRGGGVRVARHCQVAITKTSSERKQRHHEELCQLGTRANIRVLAAFEMEDKFKAFVQLLETIFIAFLGSFAGRERTGTYNPKACYDLYDQMRRSARIPEIEGVGLNGALSIHQGMAGLGLGRQMLFCSSCKRKLPPNSSIRNASRLVKPGNLLGPRRCGPCDRNFAWAGTDQPASRIAALKHSHRLWLSQGNADVCGNAACQAPRVVAANFRGWGSESRCMACFAYMNYYRRKGLPEEEIQERRPTERELAARNFA